VNATTATSACFSGCGRRIFDTPGDLAMVAPNVLHMRGHVRRQGHEPSLPLRLKCVTVR
jgi:hypothetical protein